MDSRLPPAVSSIGDNFRNVADQVYSVLLEAITERRILPGERLHLDDLALQMKVSRTPIRDALARLAGEGLVQASGTRGFCVTRPDPAHLSQLYDMRVMCECYAVEKGGTAATPGLISRLEALTEANASVGDGEEGGVELNRRLADREFHLLLVGLAENDELTNLVRRLNIHIHAFRAGPHIEELSERRRINLTEHHAIIDALRAGDIPAAKEAVRSHILNAQRRLMGSIGNSIA